MAYIIRMPKLGLEMERGELLKWNVSEGSTVEEGGVIAEVESEKSIAEVEARENGVLRRTYLEESESVPPGTPIGIVASADADIGELEAEVTAERDPSTGAERATTGSTVDGGRGTTAGTSPEVDDGAASRSTADGEGTASPRARKRAEELGVDLAGVEGTGYQGAITEDDVESAAGSGSGERRTADVSPRARKRADELGVDLASVEGTGYQGAITEDDVENAAASSTDDSEKTAVEDRSFDGMRRTIASRLGESYREAVHVTVHREADAERLLTAADTADRALETDVSVQDVLLLAVSATLDEHPAFNATFEDDVHRLWAEHNVGIAVDIDQGLIAPVLRDVGGKSLATIASERRDLVRSATEGEYTMDNLQGGTFTVTNLGVLGVESFDPIINPPQVAILGVDAVRERPVRGANDEVTWRRRLPLDLSFDHRVVDGADAARFLGTLVDRLEDPWPLLPDEIGRESGAGAKIGDTEMPERTVTTHNLGGMAGTIEAGSFEWSFDEPEDAGGSETGPTPVDVFLGGLASCLSLSIRFQAEKRDAAVDAIDVTTDADPDGGSVERIEATVRLETEADDETVERIVDLGERGCHVSQLLRKDLPLEISWERR